MTELAQHPVNAAIEPNTARGGIDVHLGSNALQVSPVWELGGIAIQFLRLPTGEAVELTHGEAPTYLKVISGAAAHPPRAAFPPAGVVANTRLTGSRIEAEEDCTVCLLRESPATPARITDMAQLPLSGPLSERLNWQSFDEKFGAFTNIFDGVEAHMVPGFHLLDDDGQEIAYVHFWTTGKGVDVSTHDHGQEPSELAPAFAETHLVLRNATGGGAMYRCEAPDTQARERMPIQAGEEHGPFFHVDAASGRPRLRANGAVDYPWHGWQGGTDDSATEAYDLVAAFEINPTYVRVG